MAFKSFSKLSSRNQSSLISQLYKLISYYGDIFSARERTYLKSLSQKDGAIYWLEDEEKNLSAAAIVDPNYIFEVDGIKLNTLGHTVSKRPGQMDRILSHIFADFSEQSLIILTRPNIAGSIQYEALNLISFSPVDLISVWPELADQKTDYFNTTKETLAEGMGRKQYHLYLKLSSEDLNTLKNLNSKLVEFVSTNVV